MNTAKECAKASGKERVHENKAALILDKRNFEFGGGDYCSPGIFLHVVQRKRTHFRAAEKTDRGAE